MDKSTYRYIPHPAKGYERRVFRPNSLRLVDAVAELNRLHKELADLRYIRAMATNPLTSNDLLGNRVRELVL